MLTSVSLPSLRCCHFDDMCFWQSKRIGKEWSLTETAVEDLTLRSVARTAHLTVSADFYDQEYLDMIADDE